MCDEPSPSNPTDHRSARHSLAASPHEAPVAVDLLERGFRVFAGPTGPGSGLRLLAVSPDGTETPILITPPGPSPTVASALLGDPGEPEGQRAARVDRGVVRYEPPLDAD